MKVRFKTVFLNKTEYLRVLASLGPSQKNQWSFSILIQVRKFQLQVHHFWIELRPKMLSKLWQHFSMPACDLIKSVLLHHMRVRKHSYCLICKSKAKLTLSFIKKLRLRQWIVSREEKKTSSCSHALDLMKHLELVSWVIQEGLMSLWLVQSMV